MTLGAAARTPAQPGPGPLSEPLLRALDLTVRRRVEGMLAGDHRSSLRGVQEGVRGIYVDPGLISYALQLATATRRPDEFGLTDLARFISFGASPRGPISLVQSARALAFIRGRDYVVAQDVDSLAKDALRHRLVLSYQALAEQVDADRILDAVLEKVTAPELEVGRRETAA